MYDQVSVNVYNLGTNSEKNISHPKRLVFSVFIVFTLIYFKQTIATGVYSSQGTNIFPSLSISGPLSFLNVSKQNTHSILNSDQLFL